MLPSRLFHATRRTSLEAVLEHGLRTSHYGDIHGRMEYAPSGPSVYLSRHNNSGNLNGNLFNEGSDQVVVVEIDSALLDLDLIYPDDLLMYRLDEEFLSEIDDDADPDGDVFVAFASAFNMAEEKAERIIRAALAAPDESHYPAILKEMWPEYLSAEGEISYLGDIPSAAITGWMAYTDPNESPEP